MKLFSTLFCSLMSLTLVAQAADASKTPVMRTYKESETGIAYTFSKVNLGGLNQMPVFVSTEIEPGGTERTKYKNLHLNDAMEFNYSFIQTLNTPGMKVFLDVNYVHADGNTSAPLPTFNAGDTTAVSAELNYVFDRDAISNNVGGGTVYQLPYFASVKTHFDLASIQTGVSKRFYRTTNMDFSVFGGVDVAYFTNTMKVNLLGFTGNGPNEAIYVKSSKNVGVSADESTMTQDELSFAATGKAEYTRMFKTRYYGTGPLVGAKLQVPFNHDFLRVNVKLEASALMGYGSSYFNYDTATVEGTPYAVTTLANVSSRQRHVFRLVPTLRGELSLDVIIKNCIITGGLQQQVYFQAFDINPLMDYADYESGGYAYSTRSRLGQLVHGGPFVKASISF